MIENIKLIAQSALRITNNDGEVIYFDPFKIENSYQKDADYIFITHPHFDHFSPEDILEIKKTNTKIIVPNELEVEVKELGFDNENILLVKPNEKQIIDSIEFETVLAYNTMKPFHRKGANWVGYIVKIDDKKVYVAGDTDNTDEARNVKCDIACVPIGGTYTMNYKEAVKLIKEIKPQLAIPTHYKTVVGSTKDAIKFKELLEKEVNVEILM